MAFNVSPGVSVQEKDATTIVPAIATTAGGFAGVFQWGPAEVVRTISTEKQLVDTFGKPNSNTAVSFFTAANFLSYSQNLGVVRVAGPAARNATGNGTGVVIKNRDSYDAQYSNGEGAVGIIAAKYLGQLGNGLKISIADSVTFSKPMPGTVTTTTASKTVTGSGSTFLTDLVPGSLLYTPSGSLIGTVDTVATDISATLLANAVTAVSGGPAKAVWEFASLFTSAPGTSDYAKTVGATQDEVHIVVVDTTGNLTGTAGTIVDKFAYASVASDARKDNGASNYYVNLLNNASNYVYWMDHPVTSTNWGQTAQGKVFSTLTKPETATTSGGLSDNTVVTDAMSQTGYALFANDEAVDVALLMMGGASSVSSIYAINNVAEVRKDCIVFMSPALTDVLNSAGTEADKIIALRNTLPSTSYAHLDSGWKYQYDRYNDVYRWIPLNGDMAGIYARTDQTNDPWWSGAGFNRGQVKNVVKLAYSPNKTDRDRLYVTGINPVVSFAGQGTVLYGDKTLLAKPSSFDRMNVRRLFIVLEKSIASASKYQLFEFNDPFTRAQFKSTVEPFLRDVKGRRGIADFYVQCDESNNDGNVIDGNRFRASIFVKPARSISFIELVFVSTPTGASFSEIVGI